MDWIGLLGLVFGLAALLVAIYGIRDVREQVKYLVTLERNRLYARVIHKMSRRFLQPDEQNREAYLGEMHEFTMLARALDSNQTVESTQEFASKESLASAEEMVRRGLGKWREDVDENRVNEVLKDWQNDKNAAVLRKIFGRPRLVEPNKDLMS